jgi:undecaprenyl-diphosphatase
VVAATTILFGLLLYWADRVSTRQTQHGTLDFKKAIIIGLSQILALIPGTSRSGITMTTALFLGLDREQSARFSFLLSIPTILGAGTLMTIELLGDIAQVNWEELFYGLVLSFISAYLCITLFLKWISSIGMTPFVIYRVILGLVIIAVLSY